MPSDLEQIIIGAVDVNDQVTFSLEALAFTPAEKKAKWAENPNADGPVLVEESRYGPAYFEMQIRVIPAASTDAALTALALLTDELQECERLEDGNETLWTPNQASTQYTAYAVLGEFEEIPTTVDGELAGWFIESPVVRVKLTCRPFLYRPERQVLAPAESALPLQTAFIGGIAGDVPAEARLVITDKANQRRRHVEWGRDVVPSAAGNPALTLKAEPDLIVTGMAGSKVLAPAGSYSANAIFAALKPTPVAICSTGPIKHIGSYRVRLRAQATTAAASFRISYRVGDGSLVSLPWREIGVLEKYYELAMRELFLEEAVVGEQVSEVLVEGKSANGGNGYIDVLLMYPTRAYGLGRGKLETAPASTFSGYDPFNQASGALAGKTADIGGNWAGAGDADDFSINAVSHVAQRTALSDAAGTPRYAFLAGEFTDVVSSVKVGSTNPESGATSKMGLLLRYVDPNNWARLQISLQFTEGGNVWAARFEKKVAGVITTFLNPTGTGFNLGYVATNFGGGFALPKVKWGTAFTNVLEALILADGTFSLFVDGYSVLIGNDTAFATGGALAKGKCGIVDEKATAGAETRTYDDFYSFVPNLGVICHSGRQLEVRYDSSERMNSTGLFWSPLPFYRGADFYLDPAGDAEVVNRLAVSMRRFDVTEEPSANLTDAQTIEVLARERFLVPR